MRDSFIGRIVGIDLARGIAILGMFALHALPENSGEQVIDALLIPFADQRAQILFAVLDGIAIGILSQGESGASSRRIQRQVIAIRGIALVALGLFLTTLGSGIVVILDYYGFYFLLVLPFVYLRKRFLAVLAGFFLVFGPTLTELGRDWLGNPEAPFWQSPPAIVDRVASWTLVGQYPASIWLGYVFLGILIYRAGIKKQANQVALFVFGAAAGVGLTALGHSHSIHGLVEHTLILLGSTCLVLATLAACLLLTAPSRFGRVVGAVARPVSAMGTMPITMYASHTVYFAILAFSSTVTVQGLETWLAITLGGIGFALIWSGAMGRGPLERGIRLLLPAIGKPSGVDASVAVSVEQGDDQKRGDWDETEPLEPAGQRPPDSGQPHS